jgi:hypothetical protein
MTHVFICPKALFKAQALARLACIRPLAAPPTAYQQLAPHITGLAAFVKRLPSPKQIS